MTPEISLAWWHMPITPAPRRLRQEEQGQPICIASSRPAWTVQQDPVSTKQTILVKSGQVDILSEGKFIMRTDISLIKYIQL
jgi:hypothetical protein